MCGRILLLAAAFWLMGVALPGDVSSQVVGGHVITDSGDGAPDVSVAFFLPDGRFGGRTHTDLTGGFSFSSVGAGKYFIEVAGAGLEAWRAGPVVLGGRDTLIVALLVAPDRVPQDPIHILSCTRPWYEVLQPAGLWSYWERRERFESLGTGSFYTQADLSTWRGQPLTVTLSALSPFLHAVPTEAGGAGLQLRGPRGCTPLVFLDGHQIDQGTEGSDRVLSSASPGRSRDLLAVRAKSARAGPFIPIDHYISLSEVAALEIYRGASDIPGEFRLEEPGSRCGAVVVWSQRGPTG